MIQRPNNRQPFKKPPRSFKAYIKFMGVSLILLFLVDFVFLKDERPHITKIREEYYAEQALKQAEAEKQDAALEQVIENLLPEEVEYAEPLAPPEVVHPDDGAAYFESLSEEGVESESLIPQHKPAIPLARAPRQGKPKIAIVIDDVGMNLKQSRIAMDLPPSVTLAFLPYAEHVKDMTVSARAKGHELIIHTPMEAMSADVSLGSMALKVGMTQADIKTEFNKMAESFEGYVGINNHMGSRLTQDPVAMATLMEMLRARGLYFLDSKTISTSVAANAAQASGVPYAVRDVFLDHQETPEFVTKALAHVERIANQYGSAIAIGHPKDVTMKGLQKWLPTLKEKGFELVPLSALIIQPKESAVPKSKPEAESIKVEMLRIDEVKKAKNMGAIMPSAPSFQSPEITHSLQLE